MADLRERLAAEAAAKPCEWGLYDEARGNYPCRRHAGGVLTFGATFCNKAQGLWASVEQANERLFQLECQRVVSELPQGWSFVGVDRAERWAVRDPQGTKYTAGSVAELLAKVRAACGAGPQQGNLL
ncbi:hypothetical protein [Hyalangium gracile]|uniref:hypothetical protein n=1 Tax=Hyalangium gracile TaxID=394092 RepID=UPI001CCA9CF0|nr:hypothetical protein [Hyalangium gracile]